MMTSMTRWRTERATVIVVALCGCLGAAAQALQGQGRPAPAPPRDSTAVVPAQPTGTAEVAGVVVATDTGRPVRRVTVRLQTTTPSAQSARAAVGGVASGGPPVQITDDQGTFRFRQLPAGDYTLTVSKPGYLPATYGQKRPGSGTPGTPISLAANQRLEKLSVPIPRGGVLTGTIVDDAGEPAFGVQVRALKYVMRSGARVLEQAALGVTDDRGLYRIAALAPGQYVIIATPRDDAGAPAELASALNVRAMEAAVRAGGPDGAPFVDQFVVRPIAPGDRASDSGPVSGYAPVYYPGSTLSSAATPVTLGLSEERSGLDLRLELVPLGRIAGMVTSPEGRSVTGVEITLVDATQALPGIGARATRVMPDGTFAFNGVAPGQYTLHARSGGRVQFMVTPGGGAAGMRVMMTSTVERVAAGLAPGISEPGPLESPMWASGEAAVVDAAAPVSVLLTLQPALSVAGRVEFVGPSPPGDLSRVRVGLTASTVGRPGESAIGQVSGRDFKISGVVPGKYRPVVLGLPGWVPKSFEVGGRDALDFPLEVTDDEIAGALLTMVPEMGGLSGTLQDPSGLPAPNYTVIVAPEDPRFWTPQSRRIQATRPATDGRFAFQNLPAGAYRLVALDDVEQESWFDPAFLRQLVPASIPVTIGERGTTAQNVRISR
jgi:hypothetical protein